MKISRCVFAIAAVVVLMGSAARVQAQHPNRRSEKDIKELLGRIEKGADRFRHSLDNALDHSRLDNTKAEDRINDFVKAFEQSTERLKSRFDDDRSAASAVEQVLSRAAHIDGFMTSHETNSRARNDWAELRGYLDELAAAYNVSWNWMGVSARPSRMNEDQVKSLLGRLEKNADAFRHSLKDAVSHSRFDDTAAEGDLERYVKEFETATDRLKDHFSRKQTASGDAEEVLKRGAAIDGFMRRFSLSARAQSDWSALRGNLDELASAYGVTWNW
jgi:DnaJ-domain-containing protein 1